MKISTIHAIAAGIVIATAGITANAADFDPMAAHRYSVNTHDVTTAVTESNRPVMMERAGFHPFAANRYTPSLAAPAAEETVKNADARRITGQGFAPFAAHRYE